MRLFPAVNPAPDGRPRFLVPAESPFFAGHFPGHPILPGIAQLALVGQALGEERRIVEIPAFRLRSPVHPGDLLTARIDRPADDTVRFELSREGEAVSNGTLRLGPAMEVPELPERVDEPGSYPPVETLVPHAPPARLVRSVLEISPEGLTGIAEIPGESPFVTDGQAPAFVGLEAAAQGAAVLESLERPEALERREEPGPRIGYLVAIRGARLAVGTLPADRPVRFVLRLTGSAPPLSVYEVAVFGETELLRGSISTYLLAEG